MSPTRRQWVLGIGFVATSLLAWFAPSDEPAKPTARPPRPIAAVSAQAGAAGTASATKLAVANDAASLTRPSRSAGAEYVDLFKSRSWYVPPPPPPVVVAPPPPPPTPTAPELPFGYLGQVIDEHGQQIVLTRSNRVLTVSVGDEIDKDYRLESYLNGTLTFLYVPLDIRQTLPTGVTQ